jgi:hypothetical protein
MTATFKRSIHAQRAVMEKAFEAKMLEASRRENNLLKQVAVLQNQLQTQDPKRGEAFLGIPAETKAKILDGKYIDCAILLASHEAQVDETHRSLSMAGKSLSLRQRHHVVRFRTS